MHITFFWRGGYGGGGGWIVLTAFTMTNKQTIWLILVYMECKNRDCNFTLRTLWGVLMLYLHMYALLRNWEGITICNIFWACFRIECYIRTAYYYQNNKKKITRGPRTLALCLTAAVGMTLTIFRSLVSKTHCCRLNQLKSGLTLTQYLTRSYSTS